MIEAIIKLGNLAKRNRKKSKEYESIQALRDFHDTASFAYHESQKIVIEEYKREKIKN